MSDFSGLSVPEIRDGIRDGKFSASDCVADLLSRMEAVNPRLEALCELYPESATEAAAEIDRRLAAGEDPGPLAGVPYTVKANIGSLEGHTHASSRILEGFRSPYDSTVVRRLREAGAILVGKTNMDEFGMGSSTENSALGLTRNPWNPDCVPGGSSGGAAAAASAFGAFHLGSDTGGSIRQPASCCGVTGLKPTYGRVSRFGLLAFASSLDQIGPLGRSAADCALALEAIAGRDWRDSTSADQPVGSYSTELGGSLEGLTLGLPREYFGEGVDAEVLERVQEAVEFYRSAGAEIREVSLPHTEYANPAYVLISAAEASSNLSRYDGIHYGHRSPEARDLADLYSRSRGEGFGPEVKRRILVGTFVLSSGYYDAFYRKAMQVRRLIRRDFEEAFQTVDALIGPTSPVPAFPLGSRLDDPLELYLVDILTVSANLASIPGVSFPCGFTRSGLPVGAQLLGRPFEDGRLLSLVDAYQSETDHHRRRPPVLEGN